MGRKPKYFDGQQIEYITVLNLNKTQGGGKPALWNCLCNGCNKQVILSSDQLSRNKSCGCLKLDLIKQNCHRVLWNDQLRKSYFSAKSRCTNPKHKNYCYYKDVVFNLTLESLFNEVGNPPSKKHTLDRIDNNKGYEVGNLRWATPSEQQHNRKDNLWYFFKGGNYLAKDLFLLLAPSIKYDTFRRRLKKGYSIEKACLPLLKTNGQIK